jgi:hypothetical protein
MWIMWGNYRSSYIYYTCMFIILETISSTIFIEFSCDFLFLWTFHFLLSSPIYLSLHLSSLSNSIMPHPPSLLEIIAFSCDFLFLSTFHFFIPSYLSFTTSLVFVKFHYASSTIFIGNYCILLWLSLSFNLSFSFILSYLSFTASLLFVKFHCAPC